MKFDLEKAKVYEVIEMERPTLVQFFEGYLPLLIKKENYQEYGQKQRSEIRQRKKKTLQSIERAYEKEYDAHFVDGYQKHRQRLNKIEQWLFRTRRFVFLRLWLLLWVSFLLFKENPGYFWPAFFTAIPVYWFRGLFYSFFRWSFDLFRKGYLAIVKRMYIRKAAAKGITKENLKEVGGFAARIEKAKKEFNEMERTFQRKNNQTLREINEALEPYEQLLPAGRTFKNIPSLMIMYRALHIGRADTWKECLEVLSTEEKHYELLANINGLKSIGKEIVRESKYISHQLEGMNAEIRKSSNVLQAQIEQVEYAVKYDNYATVDVYHHKSK